MSSKSIAMQAKALVSSNLFRAWTIASYASHLLIRTTRSARSWMRRVTCLSRPILWLWIRRQLQGHRIDGTAAIIEITIGLWNKAISHSCKATIITAAITGRSTTWRAWTTPAITSTAVRVPKTCQVTSCITSQQRHLQSLSSKEVILATKVSHLLSLVLTYRAHEIPI